MEYLGLGEGYQQSNNVNNVENLINTSPNMNEIAQVGQKRLASQVDSDSNKLPLKKRKITSQELDKIQQPLRDLLNVDQNISNQSVCNNSNIIEEEIPQDPSNFAINIETLYHPNGQKMYEGGLVNGKKEGKGSLFDLEGNLVYEGMFANDKREGKGRAYSKKNIIDGDFSNDRPNGYAKTFNRNTLISEGHILNGRWHGKGKEYYDDGTCHYIGEFSNGLKNGKGRIFSKNGVMVYEGEVKNNLLHGNGILYNDKGIKIYEGKFVNGYSHGTGTSYLNDQISQGTFRNGVLVDPLPQQNQTANTRTTSFSNTTILNRVSNQGPNQVNQGNNTNIPRPVQPFGGDSATVSIQNLNRQSLPLPNFAGNRQGQVAPNVVRPPLVRQYPIIDRTLQPLPAAKK